MHSCTHLWQPVPRHCLRQHVAQLLFNRSKCHRLSDNNNLNLTIAIAWKWTDLDKTLTQRCLSAVCGYPLAFAGGTVALWRDSNWIDTARSISVLRIICPRMALVPRKARRGWYGLQFISQSVSNSPFTISLNLLVFTLSPPKLCTHAQ